MRLGASARNVAQATTKARRRPTPTRQVPDDWHRRPSYRLARGCLRRTNKCSGACCAPNGRRLATVARFEPRARARAECDETRNSDAPKWLGAPRGAGPRARPLIAAPRASGQTGRAGPLPKSFSRARLVLTQPTHPAPGATAKQQQHKCRPAPPESVAAQLNGGGRPGPGRHLVAPASQSRGPQAMRPPAGDSSGGRELAPGRTGRPAGQTIDAAARGRQTEPATGCNWIN